MDLKSQLSLPLCLSPSLATNTQWRQRSLNPLLFCLLPLYTSFLFLSEKCWHPVLIHRFLQAHVIKHTVLFHMFLFLTNPSCYRHLIVISVIGLIDTLLFFFFVEFRTISFQASTGDLGIYLQSIEVGASEPSLSSSLGGMQKNQY